MQTLSDQKLSLRRTSKMVLQNVNKEMILYAQTYILCFAACTLMDNLMVKHMMVIIALKMLIQMHGMNLIAQKKK